jgi:glucokinase
MQLLTFLRHSQGHKHVSWDRLVSGKFGLPNLYLFATRELGLVAKTPDLEHSVTEGGPPVQMILLPTK